MAHPKKKRPSKSRAQPLVPRTYMTAYLTLVLGLPAVATVLSLGRANDPHYPADEPTYFETQLEQDDKREDQIELPRELADKADAFRLAQLTHRSAQEATRAAEKDLNQVKDKIRNAEQNRDQLKKLIKDAKTKFDREGKIRPITQEERDAFETLQSGRRTSLADKEEEIRTLIHVDKVESEKVLRIAKNAEKNASNERKRLKRILVKSVDVYKAETCRERRRGVIGTIGGAIGGALGSVGNELVDITLRSDDTEDQRELKQILKKALECRGERIPRPSPSSEPGPGTEPAPAPSPDPNEG